MKVHTSYFPALLILSMIIAGCETSDMKADTTPLVTNSGEVKPETVVKSESVSNITEAGSYTFSGKISEPITVNVSKDDDVEIIFDNVEIQSHSTAPVHILEAKDVTITLVEGSTNKIIDNRSAKNSEDTEAPNAAIFSQSDLKIKGAKEATLTITAKYQDGISSKDDLKIRDANITVIAEDDGIRGKDSLSIEDSILHITSGGHGLKSDNTANEEKGNISIESSDIIIVSESKGMDATQIIDILSGNIDIQKSTEGLEAHKITVHDGTVKILSSDDGINVAETVSDEVAEEDGRSKSEAVLSGGELNIYGGVVQINAEGDGFDSNGNATMTGGMLIINGPTTNREGPIDVNGSFLVSGGEVIAVGSSGMAETPSEAFDLLTIQINVESFLAAGTVVSLREKDGNEIFSFAPEKAFQSVTYSSPQLQKGETYTFVIAGAEYKDLTLTNPITIDGVGVREKGPRGERPDFANGETPPEIELPENWETMTEDEQKAYIDSNRPQ